MTKQFIIIRLKELKENSRVSVQQFFRSYNPVCGNLKTSCTTSDLNISLQCVLTMVLTLKIHKFMSLASDSSLLSDSVHPVNCRHPPVNLYCEQYYSERVFGVAGSLGLSNASTTWPATHLDLILFMPVKNISKQGWMTPVTYQITTN